jgi:CRISPR-associated endoribonuclease Cas6
MRVLVELQALCNCVYDLMYNHKLQGFLYGLLAGSVYADLHDKRGYKFFCFSNIFPSVDMREGDVRRFLISSPDVGLIGVIVKGLDSIQRYKERVNIGEMSFSLKGVSILEPKVGRSCVLAAGTPIVVRIPKANYSRYGIVPPEDYEYVYWRKQYPFEAFVRQIEDNIFKKYNQFHGTQLEAFPIFEEFTFQKQVCNHLVIEGKEAKIFGSIWRFTISDTNEERSRILQFGLDSGFGELNSLGFGFMNLVKNNQC